MAKKPPFVAGNWKMHMTIPEAKDLATAVVRASMELPEAEIVLAPPFTALSEVFKIVEESAVQLAAQNLHGEDRGAFTGEVSAPLLKDAGCQYVIIGHSERRQFFGETDAGVNKKISAALKSGVIPIVCIGETPAERERGETMAVVSRQLEGGLEGIALEGFEPMIIAYEPVWAIGTGKTASPAQAEEVHAHIRQDLTRRYGNGPAEYAIILYGGSVKPANAFALLSEKNIDGFLVGGASLEAESFIEIVREAIKAYKEKK
ncbi:MAG: triose-phosphate isomerase [Candidatus Aminicenantes bacterium]|nr:triose-phosphate isomerase [Candidatus Aminicenantes bacterium]